MKQSVAELRLKAGAVLEFQEVFRILALVQGHDQRVPDLRELLGTAIMFPRSWDGEGCSGFDADFEILAGLDHRGKSIVGLGCPRRFS